MDTPVATYPSHAQIPLLQQIRMAQYMLLGTVIATVVNLVLLFLNASLFVPYCAAGSYYWTWLGKAFDNGLSTTGSVISSYTATGLVISVVVLAAFLLVWWLCRKDFRWMKVGLVMVCLDTVVLLVFSLLILGEIGTSLFELLIHGAVIYEICRGLSAYKTLRSLPSQPVTEEPPQEGPDVAVTYTDELE